MADTFSVNGTPLDPAADDSLPVRFSERFGSIPTLTIQRRGVALGALPDPWMGKEVTWDHDGTVYFTGDVVSVSPSFTAVGWVLTYQCLGWRNRLDFFPHTDANTGIDTSAYNLPLDDPTYNAARAGRNVGQILTDVLTMQTNADAIDAHGLGGYTSLSPPTLPAATVADLATLTIIPQRPVYFSGEKFGSALDGFMSQYAPNYRCWLDPDGVFRFLDLRTFTPTTLTMGTDPIEPSELSRDVGDCFQRVVGRGMPIAIMAVLKLSLGQLTEQFTHDSYITNATAKAAWTPAQFRQAGTAQVVGTCTCPTTNTVTVDPTDPAATWTAGYFDQSHQMGTLNLSSTVITNYTQFWSGRVIADPGCSAGGTATLTIDNPLPHTSFDKFTITGLATGGSVVWTQYQIVNTDIRARVTNQSTYPQPFINAAGGVTMISTPMGAVIWSASGSAPFNSFPLQFTYNPATGMIRFIAPTYVIANNAAPADVWVAIPVQTNPNTSIQPPDSGGPVYAGTSHSVDGLTKTLTVTLDHWKDPGLLSQVDAYMADILDSVKDAVVSGSVVYYGMLPAALTFGMALSIAGNDGAGAYDTMGWDGLVLPVVGVDVEWPDAEGPDFRTTMQVSNRRAHLSAEMFLHPERTFLAFGADVNPFDLEHLAAGGGTFGAPVGITDFGEHFGDTSGIPTDPASYMASMGLPTNPGDYLASEGLLPDMGMDAGAGADEAGPAGRSRKERHDAGVKAARAERAARAAKAEDADEAEDEAPLPRSSSLRTSEDRSAQEAKQEEMIQAQRQKDFDRQWEQGGGLPNPNSVQDRAIRQQTEAATGRQAEQQSATRDSVREQDTRQAEQVARQDAAIKAQKEADATRNKDQQFTTADARREQDALRDERIARQRDGNGPDETAGGGG